MDPGEDTLRVLLKVIVIIGAFLDVICYKKRSVADSFLYLECLTRIMASLIPNYASYGKTDIDYMIVFTIMFAALYSDQGWQIISSVATVVWHIFFTLYFCYYKPMSAATILVDITMIVAFFLGCLFNGIIVDYIAKINSELHNANEEKLNLVNGMHEGVLILSEDKVIFCNQPALKLVNTFLGQLE